MKFCIVLLYFESDLKPSLIERTSRQYKPIIREFIALIFLSFLTIFEMFQTFKQKRPFSVFKLQVVRMSSTNEIFLKTSS